MPVIDPLRLQKQVEHCFYNYEEPEVFLKKIKELLENYSDHAYRAGELASLPSSLKSYHVPQPLLRTLKKEFATLSGSHPIHALKIAEQLWSQPIQECKDLAISVLKHLPLEMRKETFQISEQWVTSCIHPELIVSIAQQGLETIRLQDPISLINQAQKWIIDDRHDIRKFGFFVLEQLSLSISFSDLPLLFKVITPYLHRCPPQIYQEVVSICHHLIEKSPKEMAYLMRNALNENPAADAKKLIKSCLKSFPTELQADLQSAINR
ncbi:MAG: DNA alkylation repair protein [Anaerolineales bacterium]|nr:DNA alkylation repair protein [Anaerolineales bacterium]